MARRVTKMFVRMKDLGLTQEALAQHLGVTQKTVSLVAGGICQPNPEMREKLCLLFRCGDELFEPISPEESLEQVSRKTREYRKTMKRLRRFSEEVKKVELSIRELGTEIAALQKRI